MIERTRAALEQIPAERRANALLIVYGPQHSAWRWPTAAATKSSFAKRAGWSPSGCRSPREAGLAAWLSIKAAAARRNSRGWNRTSATSSSRVQESAVGLQDVVVVPIGFISDHMEVLYDLDTEARQLCERLGINMVRAATVGTHPRFVRMIRELIEERMSDAPQRLALGTLGPSHDVCPTIAVCIPRRRPTTKTNSLTRLYI